MIGPSLGFAARAPRSALPALLVRGDAWLWLAVTALGALGLVMAYSASLEEAPHPAVTPAALRHAALGGLAVAAMLVAARIDYRLLQRAGALAYLGAAALLLAVVVAGESEYGARRWLPVGGETIQPAEAAKLALVIALASYAALRPPRAAALVVTAALLVLLAGPVLLQPDTGTAVVLAGTWAGGRRWRGARRGGRSGRWPACCWPRGRSRSRWRCRTTSASGWRCSSIRGRDPLGSGFSLRQVEAALGSGGLTGQGLFGGAESQLTGVSARSSDFVFALIGEELGLLGGLAVIALFAVVAWRGLEASRRAPDAFGRLLAAGLTALILTQAMVNVAVNLRLLPATGLPLPFVSAGGSALLVMFVAAGLLQSVHRQRLPARGWGPHASGASARWDEGGLRLGSRRASAEATPAAGGRPLWRSGRRDAAAPRLCLFPPPTRGVGVSPPHLHSWGRHHFVESLVRLDSRSGRGRWPLPRVPPMRRPPEGGLRSVRAEPRAKA